MPTYASNVAEPFLGYIYNFKKRKLKLYFLITRSDIVTIPKEMCELMLKKYIFYSQ